MLLETASALVTRGESVVVTTPSSGPLIDELRSCGAETVVAPTPVIRKAALRPAGMVRLLVDTARAVRPGVSLLRALRPKALLVNTITPPLWLALASANHIPTICHVHEGEASASGLLQRALATPLLLADRLIINSEFSRDVIVGAIPALASRASVVYNTVAGPEAATPPRSQLCGRLNLLYVGRLSPRKGPDIAIEAVAMLRRRGFDVHLDLVGAVFPGYEWFEDDLRDMVAGLELQDRVTFHGFHRNIWPFAERTDISLIPSTVDEPFGNTAVEAALAARPSVVSATSGLLEATAGLRSSVMVRPRSPELLADGVERIASEWDHFARWAVRDSQWVRQKFSADTYGEAIATALREIAR